MFCQDDGGNCKYHRQYSTYKEQASIVRFHVVPPTIQLDEALSRHGCCVAPRKCVYCGQCNVVAEWQITMYESSIYNFQIPARHMNHFAQKDAVILSTAGIQ